MRRLAAAGAAILVSLTAGTPAGAIVQVIGATQAERCMDAAYAGRADRDALAICTEALTTEPLSPANRAGTLVNRAVIHMNRRDWAIAIADLDAALGIKPELAEAFFNRGTSRIGLGAAAEGVADIDRSLALGLREPEKAYYNRALARELLADAPGAYRDYRQAARLKPNWDLPRKELTRFTVTRQ